MKTSKTFAFVFLLLILVMPAFAQNSITVASDSSSGTYNKMLGEIIGVCSSDSFAITDAKGVTGGAVGNLQALVDNKAQAAFLHSDVYAYNAQSDPTYGRFQTLVSLYPEPIHVVTLKQSKTFRQETVKKWGGMSSETKNIPVDFNSLSDIKGYPVGAAGGGWVTIRVLKGGGGEFNPMEYPSGGDVLKALANGDIAAAIFVGAAPLPNIEKLDKNLYKILPIGEAIASKLKGVYRTATVNYPGMSSGPVQTLAPMAIIMTRKYSTPEKIAAQRHFRDCLYKQVPQLQDNASPNWQAVEVGDKGIPTIPYLDLPVSVAKK